MARPAPEQLSPSVFLHKPARGVSQQAADGPRVIVIATWVFAHEAHIAKYIAAYQEMFPGATILVAKAFLRHMFWIPAAVRELVPAVSAIRSLLDATTDTKGHSRPSLMLHIFSNTGLATAYNLCDAYTGSFGVEGGNALRHRLPPHATVFDSAPGRYEYRSLASAVMFGAPPGNRLQRLFLLPFAHLLSFSLWVWVRVLGGQDWVKVWGDAANSPKRIDETCRSYIYSEADLLVESSMVELHASKASDRGFPVLHTANFGESAHVAHARAFRRGHRCFVAVLFPGPATRRGLAGGADRQTERGVRHGSRRGHPARTPDLAALARRHADCHRGAGPGLEARRLIRAPGPPPPGA